MGDFEWYHQHNSVREEWPSPSKDSDSGMDDVDVPGQALGHSFTCCTCHKRESVIVINGNGFCVLCYERE